METAELAGTVVFAVSGVFAVAERRLDWFGAIVVGMATALGGGTVRDLILGINPVFWVKDPTFLLAALAGALAAIGAAYLPRLAARGFEGVLQLADAGGLAVFAVVGALIAIDHDVATGVVVVIAVISGVGGGVTRDLLAGRTPLVMRQEIYATAALAGALVIVGLDELTDAGETAAAFAGGITVFGLRLAGIRRSWSLPSLGTNEAG